MKGLSYIALALSVIALALSLYAFTGGFSGAGTAGVSTSTSTTTQTSATSSTPARITDVYIWATVDASLKSSDGSVLATVKMQPAAVKTSIGYQFVGFMIKQISFNSTGVSKVSAALKSVPAYVTRLDPDSINSRISAANEALKNIIDYKTFKLDLAALITKLPRPADLPLMNSKLAAETIRYYFYGTVTVQAPGFTTDMQNAFLIAFGSNGGG